MRLSNICHSILVISLAMFATSKATQAYHPNPTPKERQVIAILDGVTYTGPVPEPVVPAVSDDVDIIEQVSYTVSKPKVKPKPKKKVVKKYKKKPKAAVKKVKPKPARKPTEPKQSLPMLTGKPTKEVMCLAEAMFFEAQAEKVAGKIAVADVIVNRTKSQCFADTVCGVVSQRGQFQWKHNIGLRKGRVFNPSKNVLEIFLAEQVLGDVATGQRRDTTNGALYFAARGYNPSRNAIHVKTTGNHLFYRHNNKKVNCV